ncbi:unnamed protein product, partial [Didymodactylos carnosus]
ISIKFSAVASRDVERFICNTSQNDHTVDDPNTSTRIKITESANAVVPSAGPPIAVPLIADEERQLMMILPILISTLYATAAWYHYITQNGYMDFFATVSIIFFCLHYSVLFNSKSHLVLYQTALFIFIVGGDIGYILFYFMQEDTSIRNIHIICYFTHLFYIGGLYSEME